MAAGRTDKEKLAALLTGTLPQPAGGEQAGVYGKIDYGLLGRALAGVPAAQAAQVREACARWTRLWLAAIATMWTIADPPAPHVAVCTGVTKEGSPDPGLAAGDLHQAIRTLRLTDPGPVRCSGRPISTLALDAAH